MNINILLAIVCVIAAMLSLVDPDVIQNDFLRVPFLFVSLLAVTFASIATMFYGIMCLGENGAVCLAKSTSDNPQNSKVMLLHLFIQVALWITSLFFICSWKPPSSRLLLAMGFGLAAVFWAVNLLFKLNKEKSISREEKTSEAALFGN